jgi:hypothetical protein
MGKDVRLKSPSHSNRIGGKDVLDRQTEHTQPTSTTRRWQKHEARRSTEVCVGTARIVLSEGAGRNDIYKTDEYIECTSKTLCMVWYGMVWYDKNVQ